MKAYVTRSYGLDAEFELAEIEAAKPSNNEVLIRVKATSINPIDNKLLVQDLGFNPELPAVLHGDVAGVVREIGTDVTQFNIGDEVYACAGGFIGTPGALAECICVNTELIAHKPKNLSFVEAAALPLVLITAWESLIDHANIQAGENILIHAGAGGVGHIAIQIAKFMGSDSCDNCFIKAKGNYCSQLRSG